ncbi:ESPR-type extended signal peptide-containing protein [uncultured Megasphaera sp.]|uniref:ESPR-type extended signal peptide-containing protein n=2 Tax=Megasphaera TaxID=906 RepID=UPI00260BBBF4|nr:ESPR-type extended signal peptide-containing protein [uncultured Megasphaera sp.]
MNKIFKVIYSKTRHCYVVVSELAKSHCKSTQCNTAKSKTALTAAILLVLGTSTFTAVPTVQATDSLFSNDYVGTNYKKDDGSSYSAKETKNYHGAGAEGVGSNTLGMNAIAGKNTITIGDRDASGATESVYIGAKYDANNQVHPSSGHNVVSVGYGSDAAGTGSIAIGSGAAADTFDNAGSGTNPDKASQSIAIGNNAQAKQNNIAIGAGSVATATASTADAYLTGQAAVSSYVSVGGGTVTTTDSKTQETTTTTTLRRITNVADGATASDVATVGQLQALSDKVGVYDAGFGIEIDSDKDNKTNTISLNRNLGKDYNTTDDVNLKNDAAGTSLILGGRVEKGSPTGGQSVTGDYGALGRDSVTVGGVDNTVETSGDAAVVVGGIYNKAAGTTSAVVGGSANDAIGNESAIFGGNDNDAYETYATISGGSWNKAYGNASSIFGGSVNDVSGNSSVAVGGYGSHVYGDVSVGIAGGSTNADYALAAGNEATVTVQNGTAIGYQATTDEANTIAFGHDKGDVYYTSTWPQKATEKDGKYYDAPNNEITEDQYEALRNADHTFNDYSQKPKVTENKYDAAAYNRLVKVADGVDDHDVVVMEQLKNAKNDLKVNAGWGINVNDVTTKNDNGTETTTKNVISLNRNLGTNYGNPWKGEGKVTFEAGGENSMILGGAASILFNNEGDNVKAGAYGKDSVLVGGFNNLIDTVANDVTQTGENAVIVGGDTNTVTGRRSVIVGGYQNKVSGGHSIVIGGASNEADGGGAGVFGGQSNKAAGGYSSVLGGDHNEADGDWSSAIGGTTNTASGLYATTLGGINNDAKGNESVVVGGVQNVAIGKDSTVNGGAQNTSYGSSSYAAGGMKNMAFGNASVALGGQDSSVNGKFSTGIAGGSTGENAIFTLAAGYQSVVADSGVEWRPITQDEADKINQGIKSWPGYSGVMDLGEDSSVKVLDRISTAVGYQSTADAPGVIAFGHDKGDVASVAKKWKQKATMEVDNDYSVKYYDANHKEISADDYYKLANADGTLNDYTQDPIGTENTTYQSAYYNRLVKAADGIDAHDAVVMEQLKPYTKSDASNIGSNLKTYTVGDDGETIIEADATEDQKKANKDAWGKALGADPFTAGTATTATNASTSDQLVTGNTLYNYDAPVAETGKKLNYVSANNTTGQNLSALDAQVKANADKGLKFAANSGAEYTAKLGSTVKIQGTEKKAGHEYTADNLTTEIDEKGNITILMDKDMSVEKLAVNGKDGKDGAPGSIGINGRDGKSGIGIDGKDGISIKGRDGKDGVTMKAVDGENGTEGHIGLTGPAGTNGKDGTNAIDITVKNGYDKAGTDGKDGVKGEKGVDGTSLTRIVYKDGAGEHQVATMEDGLKFKGDDTTVINKKLNNTMEIIGGADSTKLTDKNIGVNSDGDKLKVQLSKDLTGMNSTTYTTTTGEGESATTSTTVVNGNGLTITDGPSITNKGIDGGNKVITKVGSGIEKDATGNITEASKTNAANIGDVQTIAESTATSLTDKGLKFAANSGAEYTAKLGSTVKIQGTAKKENHEYTADNLTTEIDENGNITILMDKDMSVEKLAVNGKDGKDGAPGSIGINGRDGKSGIGIDGKDGISIKGRDGKDGVTMKAVDGENGTEGHIGLTGPAGTNGKDGTNAIDITVKNGYDKAGTDGKDGVKGEKGVDGTSLTRIVYKDGAGEHQVATMEDGLKFKGDDGTEIAKKLNNTLDIIGGADSKNLTEGNIGVNSTDKGQLKVQLAKDLKGITSIGNQTTTKVDGKDVTTGAKITLGADGTTTISGGDVNVSGNKITHVGSGIETDANGKYTVTDQNKGNAANIGDVQNMVNDAKTELISGDNGLNNKANIDASNIGANLKDEDGKTPASDAKKTANENAWGKAIGTGEIEANNGQLVTGNTVYNEVRPKEDGNYVKTNQTTGANLSALDSKIGKLDKTKEYNYIDSKESTSISDNLTKLDTQVKKNADDITNINNSISSLNQNAVKYDDSSKSKISLGGEGGTTITNVKDGSVKKDSTDAVNGGQLWQVDQKVDTNTTNITKNAGDITNLKNLSNITDAGKTVIKNLSKDAVQIKAGTAITVDGKVDETTGNKTYTISANNNGKVAKDDGNLISGDTLYKEVHVDSDGSYIKSNNTVGQNLSALDSGLKTTSDLIHTNAKGDTIQIGGNSTATKIDVSGKDKDGNTTGRVITGVMTDGKDPNSAANVGYVNGLTAANTQQIYRDMNNAYSRLDTNINRAAAGSNALAALHPLDFDPADKASFAVGYGHYHNANAAAVGAFYQPNANTMVNMGISLGNGDPGFNAGVSFKIGKGSAYNGVSKAEMAQTIHDQAEEISAIKANDAAKDKRIDALEKENQEMKKQIQEILSRLNG